MDLRPCVGAWALAVIFVGRGGGHPEKTPPLKTEKKTNGEKSKKRVPRSYGEITPPPKGKT